MVVVAIVVLLAAILFPVFGLVREKARQASCTSNLKQIGLAGMMYLQDNDQFLPPYIQGQINPADPTNTAGASSRYTTVPPRHPATIPAEEFILDDGDSGGLHYLSWMDAVHPYANNIQIWSCPSQPDHDDVSSNPHYSEGWFPGSEIDSGYWHTPSLGLNYYLTPFAGGQPALNTVRIHNAAQKIWMMHNAHIYSYIDYLKVAGWAADDYATLSGCDPLTCKEFQRRHWPHNDGTVVVYCDGHVKWHSRKDEQRWYGGPDPFALNISPDVAKAWDPDMD